MCSSTRSDEVGTAGEGGGVCRPQLVQKGVFGGEKVGKHCPRSSCSSSYSSLHL